MKPLSNTSIKTIILLLFFLLVGCRETIVHDVDENDANRIMTGLDSAGFNVEKERQPDGKWNLLVKKSESLQAIRFLDSRRLLAAAPRNNIAKSGMIRDRDESRFRFERSLSAELEYTLGTIDGVLDVRVHLNLPERDPLLGRKLSTAPAGSGSVLLIVQDANKLNSEQVKRLVSGAGGIPVDQINVLISQATANDYSLTTVSQTNSLISSAAEISKQPVSSEPVVPASAEINNFFLKLSDSDSEGMWVLALVASTLLLMLGLVLIKKRKLNKVAQLFGT